MLKNETWGISKVPESEKLTIAHLNEQCNVSPIYEATLETFVGVISSTRPLCLYATPCGLLSLHTVEVSKK